MQSSPDRINSRCFYPAWYYWFQAVFFVLVVILWPVLIVPALRSGRLQATFGIYFYLLLWFMALFACLGSVARLFQRLCISNQGITFRGFGYQIEAAWDELVDLSFSRRGILTQGQCLSRKSPLSFFYRPRNKNWEQLIPLSDFSRRDLTGPLAEALRQHAPGLFTGSLKNEKGKTSG